MRAPDLAWVKHERLDALSEKDFEKFLPLCPNFVLELRSPSDSVRVPGDKMLEYIENGAQLGWLLDPFSRKAFIYRPQTPVEILDNPPELHGDPLLPGFTLDLHYLWGCHGSQTPVIVRLDHPRIEKRRRDLSPH